MGGGGFISGLMLIMFHLNLVGKAGSCWTSCVCEKYINEIMQLCSLLTSLSRLHFREFCIWQDSLFACLWVAADCGYALAWVIVKVGLIGGYVGWWNWAMVLWRFSKYILRLDLFSGRTRQDSGKTGMSMDGWIHIVISRTNIYIEAWKWSFKKNCVKRYKIKKGGKVSFWH